MVHLVTKGDGAEHRHGPTTAPGPRAPRRIVEDPIVIREPGEGGDGRSYSVATAHRGERADGGGVGREDTRGHPHRRASSTLRWPASIHAWVS